MKGTTSGSTQDLLRVAVACDRDALRFTVRQHGDGFCHLGTRSCWGDDDGTGPNHVLPTDGGARFQSGLSVMTSLKTPTWLALADPAATAGDAARLARLEGLEAHARAAELRA